MRYLIDTGIAQEFIGRNAKVVQRVDVARRAGNRIGICTPVLGELWSGLEGSISREATAALFITQALGYSLSLVDQVVIVLTTLVASVGAGGIPSGSFVTLPLIFAAVRLPAKKTPILLTVDWFLDRCRTTSS